MRASQVEVTSDGEYWTARLTLEDSSAVFTNFQVEAEDTEESAEDVARALWRDCPWRFTLAPIAPFES